MTVIHWWCRPVIVIGPSSVGRWVPGVLGVGPGTSERSTRPDKHAELVTADVTTQSNRVGNDLLLPGLVLQKYSPIIARKTIAFLGRFP